MLLRSLLLGRGKRESRMDPEISAVNQIELEAAQEKIKSDFFVWKNIFKNDSSSDPQFKGGYNEPLNLYLLTNAQIGSVF